MQIEETKDDSMQTVRKSKNMSENSIFWKILNLNFYAKKSYFLRIFKGKNYLNKLNFCAKNHDFDQKQNYQKLEIIEFEQFLARKFKI